MPMSLEIKVKENENTLSLEEIEVVKALEVLQDVCTKHSDVCGNGGCPLWSINEGNCIFQVCYTPLEFEIKPRKLFFAVE